MQEYAKRFKAIQGAVSSWGPWMGARCILAGMLLVNKWPGVLLRLHRMHKGVSAFFGTPMSQSSRLPYEFLCAGETETCSLESPGTESFLGAQ